MFSTLMKVEAMVYLLEMVKFLLDHSCVVVYRIKRSDGFFTACSQIISHSMGPVVSRFGACSVLYNTIRYHIVGIVL